MGPELDHLVVRYSIMSDDNLPLIECPSCETANRVRVDRLEEKPKCGRCKADLEGGTLYASTPIAVPEGAFDSLLRHSRLPILVDFWAEWCAPCRQMHPILDRLAGEMARRLLIAKVDTDASRFLASRFGIQAIPTLVLLRSGLEVDRITGLLPLGELRQRLERYT
jgi:thioredoxin 2